MDTTELERAYKALLAVAPGPFGPPADAAEWTAERHLAHIVAIDRLLIGVTTALLAAAPTPSYDTTGAGHGEALDLIARAAGDHDGLVATVRQTGRELVLLARRLEGRRAAYPVPTRIVDGGVVRVDTAMPWSGVLATHGEVHIPEHTAALSALARPASG